MNRTSFTLIILPRSKLSDIFLVSIEMRGVEGRILNGGRGLAEDRVRVRRHLDALTFGLEFGKLAP